AGLGTRAWAGLDPVAPAPFTGPVTLLSDPADTPFGVRVDVRVGDRRVELEASGAAAGAVTASLAGERLIVSGRLGPPPPHAPWLVPRHVVGRLRATSAERLDAGSAPWRAANRFRRLLGRGAEVLPQVERSLYGGFVLGDDRGQPPEVVDDFRGAGLTHVLVVSGQNLAFVLVLLGPLLQRSSLGVRWALTIAAIAAFGVVTRFEPSVLRASAMAALSVAAAWSGRPTGTLRLLALSVAGLLLVDPLLVHSVGFQLSVAASAGIAVLGPPIAAHLRGPAWWREAMSVTVAAQLGVAPVLVPRFGGLPVVALAANLVAVPVAGLVTTWGLPAGVVAGLGGPAVAHVAHLPTRLLIGWVAWVARVSASLPLGEVATGHLLLIVVAGVMAVQLGRRRPTWLRSRRLAEVLVAAVLLQPAFALHRPPARTTVAGGSTVIRSEGATVLQLRGSPGVAALLQDLRRAGVRRIDVLRSTDEPDPDLLRALRHRWPVTHVGTSPG
ncbi:MAG: ComEC/Rec2 family competence protein, partial [Actinobacteria bacterium]|nr:ComEC/Rec2 family competence protein [Actinomycetota bacterium]